MSATVLYQSGEHFSVPKLSLDHRLPFGVRLTAHDFEVLDILYRCGGLTTRMLRDWCFTEYQSAFIWCRERLRDYMRAGWVQELKCPKRDKGFWQLDQSRFMYRLTKSGVEQLFQARQRPLDGLKWNDDFKELLQRQDFCHLMELNRVLSKVFVTASEAGVNIDAWEHDNELKKQEAPLVYIKVHEGPKRKRGITPDATLMVSLPGSNQPRLCFLEVERKSNTGAYTSGSRSFAVGRRDWRQKVLAMIAYYTPQNNGASLLEQEYGTDSLRILSTFHSEQRLAYRKKIAEVNGGTDGRFWFTTLERLLTPGMNSWTSKIWQVAGWEGLHKLI